MGIISKEIGQDWRKLGVALQFNEQDLLEFQKETSFFTKTSKMLKNWQHKNDATTATLNNLIEALRSGYQMELAKKCENL